MLKHSDRVKIACMAQLVNVIAPIMTETGGGVWKQTIFYPYYYTSVYGRGVALNPIINSPKYDSKDFTDVPYLDSSVVFNKDKEELVVFALNRHLENKLSVDVDIRSFDNFEIIEHVVLENDNTKETNTIKHEHVKPHLNVKSFIEDGKLIGILARMSWNMITMQKIKSN